MIYWNEYYTIVMEKDSNIIKIINFFSWGARCSEICALRWPDIDFDTRMMFTIKSLKLVDGIVNEKTTKQNY